MVSAFSKNKMQEFRIVVQLVFNVSLFEHRDTEFLGFIRNLE